MKVLLTGGAVAVVLAVLALFGYLHGPIVIPGSDGPLLVLRLPLSAAIIGFLLMLCWVQYRMWTDLRDRLHQMAAPLYRYHPQVDAGIDIERVQTVSPFGITGMGQGSPHLEVSGTLEMIRSRRLLVTCDGPFSRAVLEYQLLPEEHRPADKKRGILAITRGKSEGKTIAPNSFQVDLPADRNAPLRVYLNIYGYEPPAVVSIEWL